LGYFILTTKCVKKRRLKYIGIGDCWKLHGVLFNKAGVDLEILEGVSSCVEDQKRSQVALTKMKQL